MHAKAKGSPGYRFYALYDKVYRARRAGIRLRRCRANDGAPGVDGQTFEDIEAYGLERWLDELADELRSEDVSTAAGAAGVHPETGRQATAAGDPTIRDRVVQMAAVLVLEPIFEADLSRSNTPTGRTAAPWTPSGRSTGC